MTVVTTRASICGPPAISRARRAALVPISEVVSPATAWWRSRMPVRSMIQVSEVSTMRSRSALLRIPSGRWAATERMPARRSRAAVRFDGAVAGRVVAISSLEARARGHGYGPGGRAVAPGGGGWGVGERIAALAGCGGARPAEVGSAPCRGAVSVRRGAYFRPVWRPGSLSPQVTAPEPIGASWRPPPPDSRQGFAGHRSVARDLPGWRAWPSAGGPRSRSTPPS